MFEVTVEAGFSSGHYLRNYRGKCENPHGHNYKVVSELNPSAENLAKYFFDQTSAQLHEMTAGRVRVKGCTLYETDTSFARYYE